MTAPTPRPSLTPLGELVDEFRKPKFPDTDALIGTNEAYWFQKGRLGCADELAAALKAMRCETCRHREAVTLTFETWCCEFIDAEVPREVNGQPFGCLAHEPRKDGET